MKYILFDKKQLMNEKVTSALEEVISQKVSKFDRYFKTSKKPNHLEVHVSTSPNHQFHLSVIMPMKTRSLYVENEGENIIDLAKAVFNKLELLISREKEKERRAYLYNRKIFRYGFDSIGVMA